MSLVLYTLAALCMLVGLAGTVLPVIPGLPLMFAGMLLAAWTGGFAQVGLWPLSLLGLLTVFAVLMDFWVTALGAQKVGASKKAVMGAALGALAGLFFAPWGVFIGPFAGAARFVGLDFLTRVRTGTSALRLDVERVLPDGSWLSKDRKSTRLNSSHGS